MNRAWGIVAAMMVATIALSSCRDGGGGPSVTPLETPSVTPSVSASTSTPSAVTSSASPSPDPAALAKEAEGVYRQLQAEANKLEAQGGADSLPAAFGRYAMDPYLGKFEKAYKNLKASGSKSTNTDRLRMTIAPHDPKGQPGAMTALFVCLDGSKVQVHRSDGSVVPGSITTRVVYFKRDADGKLKAFEGTTERVKSC